MNTCYSEYEAAYHRQTLLHEAAIERKIQQARRKTHDKFGGGKYFWYEALALPIPFYNAQYASISQKLAYDAFRRRTQSLVWMVGSAAFGLGLLVGGWLNLEVALAIGCIAALMACVPVVLRSMALLRRRMMKPVLR